METFKAVMCIVGACVSSYMLGSISFAIIFSKLFGKKDVRKCGSGNAGMTNVMRSVGLGPGLLTFLFEALKARLPVFWQRKCFFPLWHSRGFTRILVPHTARIYADLCAFWVTPSLCFSVSRGARE